jgi:hypothetical protein
MTIPDEHLDDFIARWQKAYGETLTRSDALTRATELLELYKLIAKTPPKDVGT